MVNAIVDQFVGDYKGERKKGLINLWFEVPYYNQNWRGDYQELARILRGAGFEVNVLFGPENNGVKDWLRIPEAQFNLVVSPWVGVRNAEHLEKKYGQPFLHIPEIPIGAEATAAFIRKVVDFAGIDKEQSEKFIEQENGIYYYYLEHFSEFFAEYWYGMPSAKSALFRARRLSRTILRRNSARPSKMPSITSAKVSMLKWNSKKMAT